MSSIPPISRRRLLSQSVRAVGALGIGCLGGACLVPASPTVPSKRSGSMGDLGPLRAPDANGVRLPEGFEARIVATTGEKVAGTDHVWHGWPDGGATFATDDGGWIYVSNAELDEGAGGVSALRFQANGDIADAYSILQGTSRNCAGGPTPWQTWLSCEEVEKGQVYECDPLRPGSQGIVRPAMGSFAHEAAAVDPVDGCIYLTEDHPQGLLYRFIPDRFPDLSTGRLEAAEIVSADPIVPGEARPIRWHPVDDPSANATPTRNQPQHATPFSGGEGCWYENGLVYFSTKGDDRIWKVDVRSDQILIFYDRATSPTPILSGVDNVLGRPNGDLLVAEDGGDLEIVGLSRDGRVFPLVQLIGQPKSEIAGPAMSPDGSRLYFSSQRHPGTTYEVRGPFQGTAPSLAAGGARAAANEPSTGPSLGPYMGPSLGPSLGQRVLSAAVFGQRGRRA